jgi:hypothetical protein
LDHIPWTDPERVHDRRHINGDFGGDEMSDAAKPNELEKRLLANGLDECDEAVAYIATIEAKIGEMRRELIAAHNFAGEALKRAAKMQVERDRALSWRDHDRDEAMSWKMAAAEAELEVANRRKAQAKAEKKLSQAVKALCSIAQSNIESFSLETKVNHLSISTDQRYCDEKDVEALIAIAHKAL